MFELKVGEIYQFGYESTNPQIKNFEVIKSQLKKEVVENIIDFLKTHEKAMEKKFNAKIKKAKEISVVRDKKLQKELKKEFNEQFSSKEEKSLVEKAQNLFIRLYNPENIIYDEDYITAIYAGKDCTITGKITHKWFVISETNINKNYFVEDMNEFIEVK